MKKLIALILMIVMMFSIVGCGNKDSQTTTTPEETSEPTSVEGDVVYPLTVTDSEGRSVTFDKMPERLVSAVPSNTEIIYALGKGDQLVGVSVYCNYPEEALSVNKIGDYNGPNLELIIDAKPDVFFAAWLSDEVLAQLEGAGIPVIMVNPSNIEETYQSIQDIGNIIGSAQEAKILITDMRKKQENIIQIVKGYQPKTVFYEVWHDPLMTVGTGSFINELITMANGINIAQDAESAYPEYSLELLISKNPQVYMTTDDGFKTAEDIFARNGYENIEAISTGQVFLLHPDITSRPGPRIIDGLEMMAMAIHPEAFEGK
ncbi:MAG: Periplasmic binding protein [Clostridiales bacterium 38_11]|nr:MAG: Periplasmic binding protein [Clostridiales bacterium 38_11]